MTFLKSTVAALVAAAAVLPAASAQLSLTILHNNDGESKVLPLTGADAGHGGASYFVGLVNSEKTAAAAASRHVLTLSSGDNFLAGVTYSAGQGVPNGADAHTYYDARVINAIGYDAVAFGNHDFDFGPNVLAEFIGQTNASTFYVNTNANFAGEAALQAHVASGKLAKSRVVVKGGVPVGIVAAITPQLPTLTSAGAVTVPTTVAADIQAEINALKAGGVQVIVLLSHLQTIAEEIALVPQLEHVDVVVSGGGSEFLRNTANPHAAAEVLPSDVNAVRAGLYPIQTALRKTDSKVVPIVTTKGEYRYLGRLEVNFNAAGDVTTFSAGNLPGATDSADGPLPVKHAGFGAGAITPDPTVEANVIAPVSAFTAQLAAHVLDDSIAVALDGTRAAVRSKETNEGNLLADAILFKAKQLAAASGGAVDAPVVAFTNGGGMRKDAVIAVGTNFTELTTFEIAAFANFIAVLEDVTPQKLKSLLENGFSQTRKNATTGAVESAGAFTGRFAQIAGMTVNYNIGNAGSTVNAQGNVTADGTRVRDLTLADGTIIYENGALNPLLAPGFTIDIATIDFLARGGDGYPIGGTTFTQFLGETYQEALEDYVIASMGSGGLGGSIDAVRYGGPVGRIVPQSRPDVVNIVRTAIDRRNARITDNIRTNGYETAVTLQYGLTASYGATLSAPAPLAAQPLGTNTAQTWDIPGLQPGIVYHFRINATNELGTTSTSDSTFVAAPNAAPTAQGDAIYLVHTTGGAPITIPIATLLANDRDANADPLALTAVGAPVGGSITMRGPNVLFTPERGFDGFGSFQYSVADDFGSTSTGEVIVRSAAALSDSYAASIDSASGQDGFASIKIGRAGAFTGSLVLDGVKSGFRGTIGLDGAATIIIPRPSPLAALTLTLELDLLGDLGGFTGSLDDGADSWTLTGDRAANPATVARYVGQFNAALDAAEDGPAGTGFALVKVSKLGGVKITGKLGDGHTLSLATIVKSDLQIPVFTALYRNPPGRLAGVLAFPDAGTIRGDLAWQKPAQSPTSQLFTFGFETTVGVLGHRYVRPLPNRLPAGFAAAPAPFTLVLSAGQLASAITKSATLAAGGTATITSANAEGAALKLSPATGVFTGSFTHPVTAKRTAFSGALFDAGLGAGCFVTPTASGQVSLTAN